MGLVGSCRRVSKVFLARRERQRTKEVAGESVGLGEGFGVGGGVESEPFERSDEPELSVIEACVGIKLDVSIQLGKVLTRGVSSSSIASPRRERRTSRMSKRTSSTVRQAILARSRPCS